MGELPFEHEAFKIFVKKEAETDFKYGKKPEERTPQELLDYGIININKPQGPTSHQISDCVKKILEIKKAGHGGTLDPNVTGVLPVALGKSTKVLSVLLKGGKEYVCVMHLHEDVEEKILRQAIKGFVGRITQMPPIKSSVKRQFRQRTIYYIEILEIDGKDVLFRVGCEAGTYIRKLCFDIGEKLNMGAHMAELIRTKTAGLELKGAVSLQDLEDAYWYWKNENNEKYIKHCIQPIEKIIGHLKKIWVMDSTVSTLCYGVSLKIPGISKLHEEIKKGDLVAIMTLKDELVALGEAQLATNEVMQNARGIAAKITAVIMAQNNYPSMKKEE